MSSTGYSTHSLLSDLLGPSPGEYIRLSSQQMQAASFQNQLNQLAQAQLAAQWQQAPASTRAVMLQAPPIALANDYRPAKPTVPDLSWSDFKRWYAERYGPCGDEDA